MNFEPFDSFWDRKNVNKLNDFIGYLLQENGAHVSLMRNLLGSTKNLLVVPEAGYNIASYATKIGDPYFNSLQSLSTTPSLSMNVDTSMTIKNGGYFFYTLNAVNELAPNKQFSLLVNTVERDSSFKVEYSFINSAGQNISVPTVITESEKDVYLKEAITIPSDAVKIMIRLDNRTAYNPTYIKHFVLVGASKLGLFNFSEPSINENLTQQQREIDGIKERLNEKGLTISYNQPTDFNLNNHLLLGTIYTDGKGKFGSSFDASVLKNSSGKTYYVSGGGSNTNDGLSRTSPLADIYTAMNKTDAGTIMIDGEYDYYRTSSGYMLGTFNKNLNFIGYNGRPKIISADILSFIKTDGYTNVYQATRSAVSRVINKNLKDDNGDYLEFKKVNSIAEVDSTPNSWYTASDVVYVNQNNSVVNDKDIACLLSVDLFYSVGDYDLYLENIEIVGGKRNIRLETTQGSLVLKDVKGSYSVQSNGNGLELVGGRYCISQNVEFSKQMMDGFNYHKGANGELPYFVEIDCIARDNGFEMGTAGSKSNNGSTAHDGIKGIRLNGLYARNDGGNLADVNAGTQTWNLGSVAFGSYQMSDFQISTGAQQFLDCAEGFGSTNTLESLNAEDKFYLRRAKYQTKKITGTETVY